jgi:membrane protease YdiL (CAAX protease family)
VTAASPPAPTLPADGDPPPPWGLGEVALAAIATLVISVILASVVLSIAGVETTDEASLVLVALVQTTLWVGMLGSIGVVLRLRGGTVRGDLGLRLRWIDVPVGIVIGVVAQLVLVPLASWPWIQLLGRDGDELKEPACRLADKADDPLGIVLLFAITVIGAPIVEELFFRGFVQRAALARFAPGTRAGTALALLFTAVLFGLTHFQLLQAPALIAFGLVLGGLAAVTRRLGASIVTHMAFNATTVVQLVVLSSSIDDTCGDVLGVVSGLVR